MHNMQAMWMVNISKKGEIIIPKEVRDHFGLVPGCTVKAETKENGLFLYPKREEAIPEDDGKASHRRERINFMRSP